MAFPDVKGPGGKRYELFEGMKQHFLSLYGEWENGTIMCPPLFPRDFISPVGDLPGVAPLKQTVIDTIRGDDAEEKIFEILKQFGVKENQPMFVLSKLKITEFIKYCMSDQTINHDFQFQAEIDFAIVHLNIGVILVEVKATEKFPKRKAFNQLSEGEKIIKGLLRKDSLIPVYKVVALPNMDGSGNCKNDVVILKKSDVGSCEVFSHWIHSHFDAEKCGSQEKQELRNLLYKLVGQRTKVGSSLETVEFSDDVHPNKVVSKQYKNVCSQTSLGQRYACSTAEEKGKKPTADKPKLDELTDCSIAKEKERKPMGLVKTAGEPGLAVMAKDIVFLNSEQLCIFEGPNHQLISGVSGSGKTILLQYKALECVRKGERVIICVPSPLNKKYEAFFEEKEASPGGVSIYTFENVNLLSESEEPFHLFIDELQILLVNDKFGESYYNLKYFLTKRKSAYKYYCWFTYDDTQVMASLDKKIHPFRDLIQFYYFSLANTCIRNLNLSENHRFVRFHLKTAMRSTEKVFDFVKEFAERTGIYSLIMTTKQADPLSKGKQFLQGVIGHRVRGFDVKVDKGLFLKDVLASILDEVRVQKQKLKEVAVLVTSDGILKDLVPMLDDVKIPWCAVGEAKDALVLDHGRNTHSFEWPVVIAVCGRELVENYGLKFLMFSRAVVKLVVFKNILTPPRESDEEEVPSNYYRQTRFSLEP